jgi:hypothetical protein
MDLFPSSGEGTETPALLGPIERATLYHCESLDFVHRPKF